MNKWLKYSLIGGGVLLGTYVVVKVVGAIAAPAPTLQPYTPGDAGNRPASSGSDVSDVFGGLAALADSTFRGVRGIRAQNAADRRADALAGIGNGGKGAGTDNPNYDRAASMQEAALKAQGLVDAHD